jgi:hypothetical protein
MWRGRGLIALAEGRFDQKTRAGSGGHENHRGESGGHKELAHVDLLFDG